VQQSQRGDQDRSLAATGVTLIALLVNIGLTIAFGLRGSLEWRLGAGVGAPLALLLLIGFGSRRADVLVRVTRWATRYGRDPVEGR
jgi:O-antigen/teichoic acid export membrane protein